jgi:hypothetical protein
MSTSGLKTMALLVSGAGLIVAGGAYYLSGSSGESAPATVAQAPASTPSALHAAAAQPNPALPVIKVWKTPTCGCCQGWVDHMRLAGFTVEVTDMADLTAIKNERGVAPQHQSCHTALIEGYTVEGHVPAGDVLRMIEERPQIAGIAAPGMPIGSPGMEMGSQRDRYDVIAFQRDGKTSVWASHP